MKSDDHNTTYYAYYACVKNKHCTRHLFRQVYKTWHKWWTETNLASPDGPSLITWTPAFLKKNKSSHIQQHNKWYEQCYYYKLDMKSSTHLKKLNKVKKTSNWQNNFVNRYVFSLLYLHNVHSKILALFVQLVQYICCSWPRPPHATTVTMAKQLSDKYVSFYQWHATNVRVICSSRFILHDLWYHIF